MAERDRLIIIDYVVDTETGIEEQGEVDSSVLEESVAKYLKAYGYKGLERILASLGWAAKRVIDIYQPK
jgi:hypothetical protein